MNRFFAPVLGFALLSAASSFGQTTVTLVPTADAFGRAAAPTINYGSGGALHVAGSDAVNRNGVPQGRAETLLKFDLSKSVALFDGIYGAGNWRVSVIQLELNEVGLPNNPIFNVGAGSFEVLWFSADAWSEGPGSPQAPVPGTGDQLTWNYLQTLLGQATQETLGTFTNQAASGHRSFALLRPAPLLQDMVSGGPVTLRVAPVSPTVGFTFNSRNVPQSTDGPLLLVTAAPFCTGDLDGDLHVTQSDLGILLAAFGVPGNAGGDLDGDGETNQSDLGILLANWERSCAR